MNVLILGSGGREHAFARSFAQSPLCSQLFVAPGNAGTSEVATNVALSITDFKSIKDFVLANDVAMVLVGPEAPLVAGIYDFFVNDPQLAAVQVIGPSQQAAMLEGSKEFAKEFMLRNQVPTARYQSFTAATLHDGWQFIDTLEPPYVLKADGLAGGKGVLIINETTQAKAALEEMLVGGKFGAASSKVVIEEYLNGIEMSVFVMTDGNSYKILPTAKDYKRIGEGDTGLNTGGMGAVSPVPFADEVLLRKIEQQVIIPTINGFKKEHLVYQGFVFIGLMIVNNEPFVIEYNVRMGDPETEVVLPRISSDLLAHVHAFKGSQLHLQNLTTDHRAAATVMCVSGGYPEAYENGMEINGLDVATDALVFHAGTSKQGDKIVTNGGRVLAITAYGTDFKEALKKSYDHAAKLHFHRMYYRKDIGFDL